MTFGLLLAALEVVAVYYPHWHRYPKGDEWFSDRWNWSEGEWALVKDMKPRFPGHHQPIRPLAGYLKGDDPKDVETEIALAANAGIDVFLYDYYYYGGKITQEEALENGFLKAGNRNRMKFALMWCYHERRNGWRKELFKEPNVLMMLDHRSEELLGLIRLSIDRYFRQPEYWRKDGKLFFSVYNAGYFRSKLGDAVAKETLAKAREMVRAAGLGELHFNAQCINPKAAKAFMDLGFDSFTDYNIGPYQAPGYAQLYKSGVREQDYSVIIETNRARWDLADTTPMPYLYSVTTGWDRTPRCRPEEPYPWRGPRDDYPYQTTVTNNTPDRFEAYLREAKERAERDPKKAGVVYINGWNEYTEGNWLVPDGFYGDGMLRAIAAVFGREPADEYSFVDPTTRKLYTVPAPTYANVAYDTRESKQKVDVWLPKGATGKTPLVVYYHGCGWTGGVTVDRIIGNNVKRMLEAGVAVAAVGYRYIRDRRADELPPVMAPLSDCEKALAFILDHAAEWNIDRSKVALAGGSAGAASLLYVALKDDNRYGVAAIAPIIPQTTLDPKEMKAWIPNSVYGAHAFGYANFEQWLKNREACLADIEKVSATALLRKLDPKKAPVIYIFCNQRPVPGVPPKDPTHAGEFGANFKKLCEAKGVKCEVAFESKSFFAAAFESLIRHFGR